MIKLTMRSPFVGTEREIELDLTPEQWYSMSQEDKDDLICMYVFEYVTVTLEDEDGCTLEVR